METTAPTASTKYVGVKGWLLFLCLCLTVFGPLSMFLTLGRATEPDEIAFRLGLLIFSIVAGVFLWCRLPVGVILAKTYFCTTLAINFIALARSDSSQPVYPFLIYLAAPVAWTLYLFQSKRVKATYSSVHDADAEARVERGRQAVSDEFKSISPALWVVIAVVVLFTIIVLHHVFGSSQ
jgi:hypothetical protein